MIRILGRASSVNVQKVMWLAAELGIEVERLDVGGKYGGNDTPEYKAKNPMGLIPTMEDGDVVLFESNAICRYLAESYGKPPWQPADAAHRGLSGQWMDWYLTAMHPPMTTIFVNLIRKGPDERDQAALDAAQERAASLWTLLDAQLAKADYLTGPEPTLGDVPVGCSVHRWFTLDVQRPALENLEAWYGRLKARPHYRDHVMAATME